MRKYPLPPQTWVEQLGLCGPDIISYAAEFGYLLTSSGPTPTYGTQVWEEAYPTHMERYGAMRNAIFRVLFVYLYVEWFSVKQPRSALEDLVLEFRDSEVVYDNRSNPLSGVAGIAETQGETQRELLVASIRIHNWLNSKVRSYLEEACP